jgi:hypothetical protein
MQNQSLYSRVTKTIAGLHNLKFIEINEDFIGSDLVAEHEALHDKFLTYTEFGVVQTILSKLLEVDLKPEDRRLVEDIFEVLCNNSMKTHEYAATYLSVKQLPGKKRAEAISRMPPSYKRYYNFVSDNIDQLLPVTYVQKIVVEWCVRYALTNGIGKATINTINTRDISRIRQFNPNINIKLLFDILRGREREIEIMIRPLVEKVYPAVTDPKFDVKVEDNWSGMKMKALSELEDLMHDVIRPWVEHFATTKWSVPAHDEWKQDIMELERLLTQITGYYNLTAGLISFERYGFFDRLQWADQDQLDETYIRAMRLGKTAIINTDFNIKPYSLVIDGNNFEPIFRTSFKFDWSFITANILDGPKDIETFYWVVHFSETNVSIFEIAYKYVLELFQQRILITATGMPLPNIIRTVTLGVNSFCEINNIITKVYALFTLTRNGKGFALGQKIHWYLHGDFLWWYDVLTDNFNDLKMTYAYDPTLLKTMDALRNHFNINDFKSEDWYRVMRNEQSIENMTIGDMDKLSGDSNFTQGLTYIFKCDKLRGYLFRTFPHSITLSLSQIITSDSHLGKLILEKEEERRDAVNSVFNVSIPLLKLCWPKY